MSPHPGPPPAAEVAPGTLRLRRLGIDTLQEAVIYMRRDCHVCRSEGFEAQARVLVERDGRSVIATLNVVTSELLGHAEAGLSEAAWRLVGGNDGDLIRVAHAPPLLSLSHVRAKVHGRRLTRHAAHAVVQDVVAGRYSDVQLAALVTACAGSRLNRGEMLALTRAMVEAGDRLHWGRDLVVDKHCVGGLPGNRTTLIVVPIVAAFGLTMPKTSSRAITSPAGTADTMETLAPVELSLEVIRRVVEREGGCIAWGGAVHLSPADDILIRVERPLDLDSQGQLVASVLSKKVAAGATHVVIDVPVGPTGKVRSHDAAARLADDLAQVGRAVGLDVRVTLTDGTWPVGRGVGPALEARDVLAVLRGEAGAPRDLRERALVLSGRVLELSPRVEAGRGEDLARALLDDGRAWRKLEAICDAQGGRREPPRAGHVHEVTADRPGVVAGLDCRRFARIAKLAGAPEAKAAGVDLLVVRGQGVEPGQPLYAIHAETPGELEYALAYARSQGDILDVREPS